MTDRIRNRNKTAELHGKINHKTRWVEHRPVFGKSNKLKQQNSKMLPTYGEDEYR